MLCSKKNILKILIQIFNGLCIVFPFGMAVIFATVYIAGGWEHIIPGHDLEYYFLFPGKNIRSIAPTPDVSHTSIHSCVTFTGHGRKNPKL